VLEEFPIDEQMVSYYEDNEWCYRVERARPGSFRASKEALAVHQYRPGHEPGLGFASRSEAVQLLRSHARFYQRHGLILETELCRLVPGLGVADSIRNEAAARLLLELLLARGTDWVFMEWMNGNLAPLVLAGDHRAEIRRLQSELHEHSELLAFLHERHTTLERTLNGGWWKLRQRLLPALAVYAKVRGGE
jgi:hypothetical protein